MLHANLYDVPVNIFFKIIFTLSCPLNWYTLGVPLQPNTNRQLGISTYNLTILYFVLLYSINLNLSWKSVQN